MPGLQRRQMQEDEEEAVKIDEPTRQNALDVAREHVRQMATGANADLVTLSEIETEEDKDADL